MKNIFLIVPFEMGPPIGGEGNPVSYHCEICREYEHLIKYIWK